MLSYGRSCDPHQRRRWAALARVVLAVVLGLIVVMPTEAVAAGSISKTWQTNGPVYSVVPVGRRVYIGGDFTYVGLDTGPGAPVRRSDGVPLAGVGRVKGGVEVAVPDGMGGYYVAGPRKVGGVVLRGDLAHVHADGSIYRSWNPSISYTDHENDTSKGRLNALALSGSTLYMGGVLRRLMVSLGAISRRLTCVPAR
jgi:hypothetical protein